VKQREAGSKQSSTFYPLHPGILLGLVIDPEDGGDVPRKRRMAFNALHGVISHKVELFKPCIAKIKLVFYLFSVLFTVRMQMLSSKIKSFQHLSLDFMFWSVTTLHTRYTTGVPKKKSNTCGIEGGTILTSFRNIINTKTTDRSNAKCTAVPRNFNASDARNILSRVTVTKTRVLIGNWSY
jgi:hypothetical protein